MFPHFYYISIIFSAYVSVLWIDLSQILIFVFAFRKSYLLETLKNIIHPIQYKI